MANNKQAAVGFIFATILLDVIGLGIIIPVVPQLLQHLLHITDRSNISAISKPAMYLTFIYASMQFIFAPILGSLSDHYGRRPILLFSLLGFGLDYIFLAFAPTIGWLFVGRVFSGNNRSSGLKSIRGLWGEMGRAVFADIKILDKQLGKFKNDI